MTGRSNRNKGKKQLPTTLGRAPAQEGNIVDLSHVQKPIPTSICNLKQIISLLKTGTEEVQDYITYECDILYECRMCRTIYRSLANFILHKRRYCKEKFNNLNSLHNQTGFVFQEDSPKGSDVESRTVSPVQSGENLETDPLHFSAIKNDEFVDHVENHLTSPQSEDGVKTSTFEPAEQIKKCSKKSITPIIEKLIKKQEINAFIKNTVEEDLSNDKISMEEDDDVIFVSEETNVMLQKVDTSSVAMFQTVLNKPIKCEDMGFIKREVAEINNILENNEAVLGPDGKVCDSRTSEMNSRTNIPENNLVCTECNFKFLTKKTLTKHLKYKHNKSCIVYPCPDCKDTFANAWGVYRHLYKVHHRSLAQVRRMRAQIHASGIRKDQELARKVKKEKKILELTENQENQWTSNFDLNQNVQMCEGCGKTFERKAAFQCHAQMCAKRIAMCNIKENCLKTKSLEDTSKNSEKKVKQNPVLLTGSAKRKANLKSFFNIVKNVPSTKDNNMENEQKGNFEVQTKHDSTTISDANSVSTDQRDLQPEDQRMTIRDENAYSLVYIEKKPSVEKHRKEMPKTKTNSKVNREGTYRATDKLARKRTEIKEHKEKKKKKLSQVPPQTSVEVVNPVHILSFEKSNGEDKSDIEKITLEVSTKDSIPQNSLSNSDITLTKYDGIDEIKESSNTPEIEIYTISDDSSSDVKMEKDELTEEKHDDFLGVTTESNIVTFASALNVKSINSSEAKCDVLTSSKHFWHVPDDIPAFNSSKRKSSVAEDCPKIKKSLKISQEFMEFLTDELDELFFSKSMPYMDISKLQCIACRTVFLSPYQLLWHMSLHFTWYKYQCSKCSFMSFSRYDCTTHAYDSHCTPGSLMDSTVLPIPKWKVLSISHDFKDLDEEDTNLVMKTETTCVKISKETETFSSSSSDYEQMPYLEPMLEISCSKVENGSSDKDSTTSNIRKSPEIMDTLSLDDSSPEKNSDYSKIVNNQEAMNSSRLSHVNVRPIRNRTKSVKIVQNDFIYDLGKALKLNDSSIRNSKIKKKL